MIITLESFVTLAIHLTVLNVINKAYGRSVERLYITDFDNLLYNYIYIVEYGLPNQKL